jgi:hypothetical protein
VIRKDKLKVSNDVDINTRRAMKGEIEKVASFLSLQDYEFKGDNMGLHLACHAAVAGLRYSLILYRTCVLRPTSSIMFFYRTTGSLCSCRPGRVIRRSHVS